MNMMQNKKLTILVILNFLSCEVADAGPVCSKPALPAITTRTQPAQISSTTQEQAVESASAQAVQSLVPVIHEPVQKTFHRYVELSKQCPRAQRLIGEFHGIHT